MIRFCLALASVAFWPGLPAPSWLLLIPVAVIFICLIKSLRPLLPVLLGLAWGLIAGQWLLLHQLPEDWQAVDLLAVGVVTGLPEQQGDRCSFDLTLEQLIHPAAQKTQRWMPRKIRLTWYRCPKAPEPAQRWQLPVRLKQPHGFVNPGGFDYPLHLFSQGIDARGYVVDSRKASSVQRLTDARFSGQLDRWRAGQLQLLQQQPLSSRLSPRSRALLAALLLGDKRGLDDASWKTLRDTGTTHLFIISGLHIGMLASVCFGLVYGLGRVHPQWRYRYRVQAAAVAAMLGSGGYALISGWGVPSQRAWVMVCALMLSLIGFRLMTAAQRLWLAATAVLLIEPLAIRQPGFWLSFAACAVLIYSFSGRLGRVSVIRQLVWAQVAIALGLSPVLLYLFQQWSPLAPLINFMAIPLVTLFLPVALGAMLILGLWPALGAALLAGLGSLLAWGWQALIWAQGLLSPLTTTGPTPLWTLVLALCGAILVLLPQAVAWRWSGLILWLPLLLAQPHTPERGAFHLTLFDVGQGLAVLIETQQHRLVYDTGPRYRSGFTAAQAAIVPYLHRQGVRQLDRLVISHADIDHAGGQAVLEAEFQMTTALSGSHRVDAQKLCQAGESWVWDGVEFRILHPDNREPDSRELDPNQSENNRSCVLQLDNGQHRVLLTGDIEADVEHLLVERYKEQLSSATLVASHHGSGSSTTEAFLDQVKPQVVLISSGWRNSYGHPHPKVIARLKARKIEWLNTATQGAIRLQVGADGEAITTKARDALWGYWHTSD
ncbi:MAG: competence protein ComEC [Motiliproteus sp.]|jgi:competence protein ComEC